MTRKIALEKIEVTSFVTASDIRGGGVTNIGVCDESEFAPCDTLQECQATSPAECGTDPEFCI